MEQFVWLEQPETTVPMVLVGGQERCNQTVAKNHDGTEGPIALLELAATCAAMVPPGMESWSNPQLKSPNPSDEYKMMGLKGITRLKTRQSQPAHVASSKMFKIGPRHKRIPVSSVCHFQSPAHP
jgi:hypothetical protein